jgi:hypothetical protein
MLKYLKQYTMRSKINWLNHSIELIVVFIGVTAAFMLNTVREDYKDTQSEQQYLNSFLNNLSYDSALVKEVIDFNRSKIERLNGYIILIKSDNLTVDSAAVLCGDMSANFQFSPKTITYESIVNSGNFGIISNYKLKEELIRYYKGFDDMKLKEQIFNEFLKDYLIPFIYANFDMLNQKIKTPNAIKGHSFSNLVLGYYALLSQSLESYEKSQNNNSYLQKIILSEME